jgi:hypothetical protein
MSESERERERERKRKKERDAGDMIAQQVGRLMIG